MNNENFTDEEKQIILDNLNEDRLIHQNAIKGLDGRKANYNDNEKQKILNKLNENRISKQRQDEIKLKRTQNKEIYTIGSKKFYKFLKMDKEYFIEVGNCEEITSRGIIIPLYYRNFAGYQKQDMMLKIEPYADNFYISSELIRVYYKNYALEDKKS